MKAHWIKGLLALALVTAGRQAQAQDTDWGQLTGDFTLNFAAYDQDSIIGTSTTQYFHEKSSAEAWMFLNYRYQGFTVNARFDMFHNSPLMNPQEAYTRQGLAFYSVNKKFKRFDITAGHFYDQFGTGIIFRAFEDRNIGLDYAIQGVRVAYTPNDSFMIKAFTGQQKNRFEVWPQVIKGINAEKIWGFGPIGMTTGAGVVNRTLDQNTMGILAEAINSRPLEQRFSPPYNVYAYTLYNTFRLKNILGKDAITLYGEYAYKTREAVFLEQQDGSRELVNRDGDVIYGSMSYSTRGLGVNVQYKKINSFILRTTPYSTLLQGIFNYLPPLSKQHSFRLPARYSISALPQGEEGYQAEVTYSPTKKQTFTANYSSILGPTRKQIFREYYLDYAHKFKNNRTKLLIGAQSLIYDQELYEGKPEALTVHTVTPMLELTHRFNRKMLPDSLAKKRFLGNLRPSIRIEAQYLQTKEDLGDFAWALVELNLAPHYSFSVSDMVNVKPRQGERIIHYYSIFGSYTINQTRLALGYAKQVQGVVCTGGVCRVEPAFSGLRFSMSTNF